MNQFGSATGDSQMSEEDMSRIESADTLVNALDTMTRMTLRQDIMQVVEPYRTSLRRPPFTMGELIIMAIVVKEKRLESEWCTEWCTTEDQIMTWMGETFIYYARELMNHSIRSWSGHHGCEYQDVFMGPPIDGFYDALHSHDLPVDGCETTFLDCEPAYNVLPHKARHYLRRWLAPSRWGIFRFLDLPPELRNKVYTKLLHFPGAAIETYRLGRDATSCFYRYPLHDQSRLRIKYFKDADSHEGFANRRNMHSDVYPERVQIMLSILATCKQVYAEAKSVFYANNIFAFESISTLRHTLAHRIHPSRVQFLRNVQVDIQFTKVEEVRSMADAFSRLAIIPLDSLELVEVHCRRKWPYRGDIKVCVPDGNHDRELAKLGAKLDPLIKIHHSAKHVEILCDCEEPSSSALKRVLLGKLKQQGKEKMKCCSMALAPKARDDVVD